MKKELELFSFFYGYPCKNVTKEQYEKSKYIILGHFTTSIFLDSILSNGLKAPINTNCFANKDMFVNGDEYYIYLTSHFDPIFAENAIKKFNGEKILILVKVEKETLELDNLMNFYTNKGIKLNCQETIYETLVKAQHVMCQCRTKIEILPEQIIEVLDVNEVNINRILSNESYLNRKSLTLSELKENISIELLRYKK